LTGERLAELLSRYMEDREALKKMGDKAKKLAMPDATDVIACEIEKMALPPCHTLFQFYVVDGKLSCQLYQRSADIFLGVPFNIASYALFTIMMAQVCDLVPGDFVHTFGDVHLYCNHIDQAKLQLTRTPYPLPKMKINSRGQSIFDYRYKDFELIGYQAHPHIKAQVAV